MYCLQISSPFSRVPFCFDEAVLCLRNTLIPPTKSCRLLGARVFACEKLLIHYILDKRNQRKKKEVN